jgi:hypothetical protein
MCFCEPVRAQELDTPAHQTPQQTDRHTQAVTAAAIDRLSHTGCLHARHGHNRPHTHLQTDLPKIQAQPLRVNNTRMSSRRNLEVNQHTQAELASHTPTPGMEYEKEYKCRSTLPWVGLALLSKQQSQAPAAAYNSKQSPAHAALCPMHTACCTVQAVCRCTDCC